MMQWETSKNPAFVVMAKPVGSFCNMACDYCYYQSVPGNDSECPSRMTAETLELFIRQYIEASPGPEVSFVWHGGEPTLAGLDFYRLAVSLQKKYLPSNWSCWNNLQTNGLLLDDAWCDFLAKERFDVGISIDGTRCLHDLHRKDRAGQATYQRVVKAMERLKVHGIRPDLLCTVTSESSKEPLAVYEALSGLDTGWIQFIPIVSTLRGRGSPECVTGKDYGDFLCKIFDRWVLRDLGRVEVQIFAEIRRACINGSAGLCYMAPECGNVLVVESDGSVYSCDHYVRPEYRLGSLYSSHLAELAGSRTQLTFGRKKADSLPGLCRECRWLAVCGGGCPKDRDGKGCNVLCEGFMHFFSYAQPALGLIARFEARGYTPDAIMAELRARLAALWKGIGRNSPCPCGSGRKAKFCCWSKRP